MGKCHLFAFVPSASHSAKQPVGTQQMFVQLTCSVSTPNEQRADPAKAFFLEFYYLFINTLEMSKSLYQNVGVWRGWGVSQRLPNVTRCHSHCELYIAQGMARGLVVSEINFLAFLPHGRPPPTQLTGTAVYSCAEGTWRSPGYGGGCLGSTYRPNVVTRLLGEQGIMIRIDAINHLMSVQN